MAAISSADRWPQKIVSIRKQRKRGREAEDGQSERPVPRVSQLSAAVMDVETASASNNRLSLSLVKNVRASGITYLIIHHRPFANRDSRQWPRRRESQERSSNRFFASRSRRPSSPAADERLLTSRREIIRRISGVLHNFPNGWGGKSRVG